MESKASKKYRNVLILEDDFQLVHSWADYLRTCDCKCDIAFSRSEAELMCSTKKYDAVVVDMFFNDAAGKLSSDGGLTFITHLRFPAIAGTPKWGEHVPIISVSGSVGTVDALGHARNAGADRTIRKPFSPEVLAEAIDELLAEGAMAGQDNATKHSRHLGH